jgi:hypothetical protein
VYFVIQSTLQQEGGVIEDQAREDIAFIRRAIEEGGAYATASSPDMLVWGIAVAIGYLGTYGFIRGWSPVAPRALWAACIGLPWLFSLRRVTSRFAGGEVTMHGPMAQALAMLWLGCGIFLTTLGIATILAGEPRSGWFGAVVAGVMGIGFFASAWLARLPWLRWVGIAWWLGELALFALRHRVEALPLAAALMLLLLAGPGYLLLRRRGSRAGA